MIRSALLTPLLSEFALESAPAYTYGLSIAAAITFGLAVGLVRKRDQRITLVLGALLATTAVWCLTYGLQLASVTAESARFWNSLRLLCPPVASPLVFLFAAEYTGRDRWLRPRRVVALFSVAAVTAVLLLTNDAHHLVRGGMIRAENGLLVGSTVGPWRLAYGLYDYALVVAAIGMLALAFRRRERIYRSQLATVIVGVAVPAAANATTAFRLFAVDLTPFAFAGGGLLFAVSLYRYRLLDIRPIARSTVFGTLNSGVLVVDRDGQVVDANDAARRLVTGDSPPLVGRQVSALFEGQLPPAFIERLRTEREFGDRVELEPAGESRWYDVSVSPIYDDTSRFLGRVVMVTDVTDSELRQRTLESRTRELERQNEHLEQVTSFVSHDLRNPLAVATGRLELARETGDLDHLDVLEDSLDRMDRLVDQMLEMARQGQAVTDTQRVDVAHAAAEAWRLVDTADATVEIEAERAVDADRDRLLRVLENLFRNAIEHGRSDGGSDRSASAEPLAVRVGDLDGGFFVEDTGPGIPEDRRDAVFEQGHSTGDDGVGLGLAIVQSAVKAHDWSIAVTSGAEGGARFEIVTESPPD